MAIPNPAPDKKFTYADYLTWDDGKRWELIDGEPVDMSPAPSTRHQTISMSLGSVLHSFLRGHACRVFAAPYDVRLIEHPRAGDEETVTVVQPDLVVVCDPAKLDERGCKGAPDLVVEILSDSTAGRDLSEKRALYERHGVREYWVVNPWENTIAAHRLDSKGEFAPPRHYIHTEAIETPVLPGLVIRVGEVLGA